MAQFLKDHFKNITNLAFANPFPKIVSKVKIQMYKTKLTHNAREKNKVTVN